MIYLASAYTNFDRSVMELNYRTTVRALARLLNLGHHVYSPIVHCHPTAIAYALPHTFDFWLDYNHDFIRRSDEVWVLGDIVWQESKGVKDEIEYARMLDKPLKEVITLAEIHFAPLP